MSDILDTALMHPRDQIALAIRLIPVEVLEDARKEAADSSVERSVGYVGAGIIVVVWLVTLVGVFRLIKFLF